MGTNDQKEVQKLLGYPGRIFLWEGQPMECVVLNVSKSGAKLAVPDVRAVPDTFVLMLSQAGGVRRNCKVMQRSMGEISVQFV
jgi:hypothetical protein